jgi:hypothetical protein
MTHAVLRALETDAYRHERHRAGAIAKLLGIDAAEEKRCLVRLHDAGQISWSEGRWLPRSVEMIDFRRDPESAQRLKAHWAGLAAQRSEQRRSGLFAYHVFAVSRADLERLEALQRDTLRQMRTIIAASTPSEVVGLANVQLFDLGA